MTVSFPWVALGYRGASANQALCFVIDCSNSYQFDHPLGAQIFANTKTGAKNALAAIMATVGAGIDFCVVACGDTGTATSIVKRAATASDIADLNSFIDGLTQAASYGFDATSALTEAKTAFFDGTDSGITNRRIILLWDGASDPGGTTNHALLVASITAAQAVRDSMSPVPLVNAISFEGPPDLWGPYLDNTPDDGLPQVTDPDKIEAAIEQAVFGTTTTPGSSYTLPTLAPPSGAPLQPLAAPTITSVTPVYPNSGGGVAGARLFIVVGDPGLTAVWKVQWKVSSDSVWTLDQGAADADPSTFTILSGLIPASGSIDVQVAYVTASQVSAWSATTTTTIAAPIGATASTSKSASFTTTADKNVYYLDTSGAAYTVTLNATPATNEVVEVWDSTGHAGTNPISFAGNGKNIAGVSSVSNAIQINFGRARLIYNGTQWLMQ
jgi:hypothetical protein